jgi:hypothetical protein
MDVGAFFPVIWFVVFEIALVKAEKVPSRNIWRIKHVPY